ncbi:hypothetical protein DMENIID0001_128420 [Sergentomyia squamirostris]
MKNLVLLILFSMFYGNSYTWTNTLSVYEIFRNNLIVPSIISSAPFNKIQILYDSSTKVNLGNILQPFSVKFSPTYIWWPNKGAYAFYTLAMIDPDSGDISQVKHWLVGNIPGIDIARGETIAEYMGSAPSLGTGYHRYIFLVFEQPYGRIKFNEPYSGVFDFTYRPYFSIQHFANKYRLGYPVAGNLYYATWDLFVPILRAEHGLYM